MEQFSKITVVLLGTLTLVPVLACGQSIEPTATVKPVAISDVPVYDGAASIDADDSVEASMIIIAMETTIAGKDITMETKVYSLPGGATWDDVKAFYKETLASTDWEPAEELTDESAEPKSIGWRRGAGANEQILVVTRTSNISNKGSTLVVMLFTE